MMLWTKGRRRGGDKSGVEYAGKIRDPRSEDAIGQTGVAGSGSKKIKKDSKTDPGGSNRREKAETE